MIKFLQLQLRAIYGIFWRDIKHFIRYPLNAASRIFEPILWMTPIYFMGKGFAVNGENVGFAAYTGNGDFMAFIIIGAIISSYVSAVFWGIGYSLKNQMDTGVLESNWLTPIPRVTHLIGQTIFNMFVTTLNTIVVGLIVWLVFGFEIDLNSIGLALLIALPMLVAIYGFGFAFAAIVMIMRDANVLVDAGNFLVNLLSGANFPVTVLPRFLLTISLSLPLTYGFDAIRGLLLGTNTIVSVGQAQMILIVFMGLMVVLGGVVFKRLERRCRQLGTIGMH